MFSPTRSSLRILFVGNSYLAHRPYVNGEQTSHTVANQVAELIRVQIPGMHSRMRSIGGGTLKQHWDAGMVSNSARGEIINGNYDLVVFQGRYDILERDENEERFNTYADRFAQLAQQNGAKVLFYGLWARDTQISSNGGDTFGPEAHRIYSSAARRNGAAYAPNGMAYGALYRELSRTMSDNQIEDRYTVDNIHPYVPLAYMAANVVYNTIFAEQAPNLNDYRPPTLNDSDARLMRARAWDAVNEFGFSD